VRYLVPKQYGMTVIFLLILVSLIMALGFLGAFFWAVKGGQYDDDYTPSVRILLDDDKPTDTKL
jgi:cbb3-type cytochrome oxidase maturation protein